MNFAFVADNRQNFQRCQVDNQLDFYRMKFLLADVVLSFQIDS